MAAIRPVREPSGALIVTPKYLPLLGGMERECALLAAEFRRRGYQPVVITEQLGMPLPRLESDGDMTVHRIPSSPDRSLFVQLAVAARLALLVLRYRRRASFGVVRTTTLPALVVGLLKRLGLVRFPTLVTAETGGVDDDVMALARRRLFRASRALVSSHDVLNGLCQANVDHLRKLDFPERKITMIPNGVDTTPWSTTRPPSRIERFLFLGRIDREKGVFELVDAFRRVLDRHPEIRLTIAGEGPARPELEARCAELGLQRAVRFIGRIPYNQLGTLFLDSDCVVLPSYSEGMPLSILEAAVHRRPLIVTDVGDMRQLFGDCVRICPPRDTSALAAALESATSDPRPSADYQEVVERISIEAVGSAILAKLDS